MNAQMVNNLRLIKVDLYEATEPQHSTTTLSPSEFSSAIVERSESAGGLAPKASLRLLHINRLDNATFAISADQLVEAVRAFRIDPYVLYLISSEYCGFHQVSRVSSSGVTSTFHLDTAAFALV